jgi:hypothetical protein
MSDIYIERVICEYTPLEKEVLQQHKIRISSEIFELELTKKTVIYSNQERIAYRVVGDFKNRKIINIMVVSKTQSGKTGSMCATIKLYLNDTNNWIPLDNIYIITGLSSREWKTQTRERMPPSIQNRVFHRSDLSGKFVQEIKNKKNVLIIMDEVQVAAKNNQTIYKAFKEAGILDKSELYRRDIKILEYTATPDGTIFDLMKWGDASSKILADVGDSYIGAYDLYLQGRVKQFKELTYQKNNELEVDPTICNNIAEIKRDIDTYPNPRYHIIRTKNGKDQASTIDNFKGVFGVDGYTFLRFNKDTENKDINAIIKIAPTCHTLIFIKEMLRCAKTLCKTYLGVLYDRYSKTLDDAAIIQGLIGRDTGYDNNGSSIIYTNIDSIIRYEKLWDSQFEDTSVQWFSKTTSMVDGVVVGTKTFNDPVGYRGFELQEVKVEQEDPRPIIKRKTFQEIREWFDANLKSDYGRGPKLRHPDENGFYKCITQFDKIEKVRTLAEFEEYERTKNWGFRGKTVQSKQKNKYRVYPVYKDTRDSNSGEWWLVYY